MEHASGQSSTSTSTNLTLPFNAKQLMQIAQESYAQRMAVVDFINNPDNLRRIIMVEDKAFRIRPSTTSAEIKYKIPLDDLLEFSQTVSSIKPALEAFIFEPENFKQIIAAPGAPHTLRIMFPHKEEEIENATIYNYSTSQKSSSWAGPTFLKKTPPNSLDDHCTHSDDDNGINPLSAPHTDSDDDSSFKPHSDDEQDGFPFRWS